MLTSTILYFDVSEQITVFWRQMLAHNTNFSLKKMFYLFYFYLLLQNPPKSEKLMLTSIFFVFCPNTRL